MQRDPNSHKGDNGKVLVIGGSEQFYGAPILCSLGAANSGVDLVFPYIPEEHIDAAKHYSLNFILHSFNGPNLTSSDVDGILEVAEKSDTAVIGPGLAEGKETTQAIKELFKKLTIPVVIDASALLFTNNLPDHAVLIPHQGEFAKITGDEPTPENVQKWAKNLGVTILCKGPKDIIANADELRINDTGNAKMTVGGTGDVLSGLVGGLIAQGYSDIDACHAAAQVMGIAADHLSHNQASITAFEIAEVIPRTLHQIES